MSAVPAYADTLTVLPLRNVAANRIDASGDFMTRHPWILQTGPKSVFDQNVAVANAARLHFHADLAGARFGDFAFHQFKIPAGLADLRRFHFLTHELSPVLPLTWAQSQGSQRVGRQSAGYTQTVVVLELRDRGPSLRPKHAVDLSAIITFSRELLLRGSNG